MNDASALPSPPPPAAADARPAPRPLRVMVSAGAKVLGAITIGKNSKIGAGSVVLDPVPPNCTVVGVPGRIVKIAGQSVPRETMDQYVPDPVLADLQRLARENCELTARVRKLETILKEGQEHEDL